MKYSIIITAFKEPKTIGKAIENIAANKIKNSDILVVAPDDETLSAAKKLANKYKNLKILKDEGKGKPAALNLAFSKAEGKILILTDGDVFVGDNSINLLLAKFENKKVGAVSGRPIPLNSRNNIYGYWAYLLTEIANERRKKAIKLKKRFFCSGYLFAIRKELFPALDKELLSEDGFISHEVYKKHYKIDYSEDSKVYIKYPDNFKDWILQKKRSAGGYNQIKKILNIEMRSFKKESFGAHQFLKHVKNLKHLIWLTELFLARIYLWAAIYKDINVRKKNREEIWQRVESTK